VYGDVAVNTVGARLAREKAGTDYTEYSR
jgi:hypothetical protein